MAKKAAKKDEAKLERIVGRKARKAVAQAKEEAEALGLKWSDMRKLRRAFGVPGDHAEFRQDWVKSVKKHSGTTLSAPGAIDWDAFADFIERILPLIMQAFSGC